VALEVVWYQLTLTVGKPSDSQEQKVTIISNAWSTEDSPTGFHGIGLSMITKTRRDDSHGRLALARLGNQCCQSGLNRYNWMLSLVFYTCPIISTVAPMFPVSLRFHATCLTVMPADYL